MDFSAEKSPHLFHIPVMGTGFSIDTPLKVAKYGISSAISLSDDLLIEQMREYHCKRLGLEYTEISKNDPDPRANRVTAYLNLLDKLIGDQFQKLKISPFEKGSEITRYFELLPESPLKKLYSMMLDESDPKKKVKLEDDLRQQLVLGSIDVNIMTKLNRVIYKDGEKLPAEFSDAMASLRGFARSTVRSSMIFSAGINPLLYGYLAKFDQFYPDSNGNLFKKIVLKVSDFRSAIIQGKFLAKRGLWISEYRIESGLNCGGHAFATDGSLMGPILEEFGLKKNELSESLFKMYNKALIGMNRSPVDAPYDISITVQGGIGTADENKFLLDHYNVDSTGWGTPFMLVPEVINLDEYHIQKLSSAGEGDVLLSNRSPLGVPFWTLRDSYSEDTLNKRIKNNRSGSDCTKGYVLFDTEFTDIPICRSSRNYQRRKLDEIDKSEISQKQKDIQRDDVMAKVCLCQDLAGSATLPLGIELDAKPAVCCGPNITNFSKIATLEEMVGHIYGRISLPIDSDRQHMFIKELSLYVDYFRQELQRASDGLLNKTAKCSADFKRNLTSAIEYYQKIAEQFGQEQKEKFLKDLDILFGEIEAILPEPTPAIPL